MEVKKLHRRQFLKKGALAGFAASTMHFAGAKTTTAAEPQETQASQDYKSYGDRSSFESSARKSEARSFPAHRTCPIQDTVGIITPSALHFVSNHSVPPNIDPKEYSLLIHGLVDRPLTYSLEELKRLPSVTRVHFLECNANSKPPMAKGSPTKILANGSLAFATAQDIWGRTSCSEWTGVPLSLLLKEAGLQSRASWIVSDSNDSMHFTYDLPLAKAMDDVLVAYGQNGEAVRPEQGYPVRLLVPGFEAPYSVKWLRQIKVVDEAYTPKTQAIEHAYSRPDLKGKALWLYYQIPPKSVILRPSGGQQLPGPGYYEITGLAWSGGGAIRKVEVSVDGGKSWKDARLQEPVHRMAHTRFRFDWTWNGQETVVQSRCTDEQGVVQPTLDELDKNWGIDSREFWRSATPEHGPFHFNAIQPWRVAQDGSVHYAMFS